MNNKRFDHLLEELTDTDWQLVFDGMDVLIKEDRELLIGISGSTDSIVVSADFSFTNFTKLKFHILNNSKELLANYYRSNPLTQSGFNFQANKLIQKLGFEDFCAPLGEVAQRTFFVEGGELLAETLESPRHRYGVFFEKSQQVQAESLEHHFYLWISSGEAYSEYIGMNVCRYNC